jgi:DnaK suppressor protein
LGSSAVGICGLHGATPRAGAGDVHRQGQREGQGEHMLVNSAVITGKGADTAKGRSSDELDQIRELLRARFDDLTAEYEEAVAENQKLRLVEIGDAAGDDQADSGSKTAERDAASSLIRTLLDRRTQAEHAMQRLEDGTYGNCEGCSKPIPVERLAVFPSATSCVACKSNRERRAG